MKINQNYWNFIEKTMNSATCRNCWKAGMYQFEEKEENACFTSSVVSALYSADNYNDRIPSYSHYRDVVKLEV